MIIYLDYTGKSLEEIYNRDKDIITDNNGNIIGDVERNPAVCVNGQTYFYCRTEYLAKLLFDKKVKLNINMSKKRLDFSYCE